MDTPPATSYSCQLDEEQLQKLEDICEASGMERHRVQYATFAFRGPRLEVTAYGTGKVSIQGRGTDEFVKFTLETEVTGQCRLGYDEVHHPEWFVEHGGMDESGKGDLFGPLVSACVVAGGDAVRGWLKKGVRDCKTVVGEAKIFALERLIRSTPGVVVEVFSLNMRKYNELYGGFGENLNRLLAWYHSKSLANALLRRPVSMVLLDQFSRQPLVQHYFRDVPVEIRMRPRAEEDPVVAAASIVARGEFLRAMRNLSQLAGETLKRGAGEAVLEQGKALVRRLGAAHFGEFAKLHFSTAQKALFA